MKKGSHRAWAWVPMLMLLACNPEGTGRATVDEAQATTIDTVAAAVPTVIDGPYQEYDPEGRLVLEGSMKRGERHGIWTSYYPDGRVRSRTDYRDGKLQGVTTTFRPNGGLYYTGQHEQDVETGTWRFYDASGNLVRTVVYDSTGAVLSDSGEAK